MKKFHYIIGVDEAGRGAWAGPVVAGAFCVPLEFSFHLLPFLTDSKKLTPKVRDTLFEKITLLSKAGKCIYASSSRDALCIDSVGIREANRLAMQDTLLEILDTLKNIHGNQNFEFHIQIDGKDNYRFDGIDPKIVKFVIRGDLTEKEISAASIVAKVTRDRKMCDFSKDCPEYRFDLHKGYGTKKHHEALLYYGIHTLHRKSYAPVKALISEAA